MEEMKMAKKYLLLLTVLVGLIFGSCATYSTRDGVVTPIGLLTPTAQVRASRDTVGSYFVIAGLFTIGYRDFLNKTDGKDIDIMDSNFLWIFRQIIAVERPPVGQ
jgi:hypothetical protein